VARTQGLCCCSDWRYDTGTCRWLAGFPDYCLQSNQITALEYTLSTWVIPVSVCISLLGCWACLYHLVDKWNSIDRGGSWGCNLLVH
jgi:hypothetical protein